MENKISEMKRHEVIYELAKYCHPRHYHYVITWKTEYLKTLLEWYIENPKLGLIVTPGIKAITIIQTRKTFGHAVILKQAI